MCLLRLSSQIPTHPTTGILAIYVALNYCDVIHIAGFGYPESEDLKHPIHYYGYDTMKSMKVREEIEMGCFNNIYILLKCTLIHYFPQI